MGSEINLQNDFLNQVRKEKIGLTIYLVNGFRLSGIVKSFDNFTILLKTDEGEQLVYKHAVSTISPEKDVKDLLNNS
ncbi:RNA chaperone Hfq [Natroniella sulfidigena]|uniref:RNA chaperone Hfq n=1 Tax=Natroniella sulfidigena TaxID=723921 RepID=UPI00200A2021|nr:RNA chaperone Hfq [Natroniella sulfidigena]MCK8817694.1 RNA chaperone Hfq [Natroniella sulfidigena]